MFTINQTSSGFSSSTRQVRSVELLSWENPTPRAPQLSLDVKDDVDLGYGSDDSQVSQEDFTEEWGSPQNSDSTWAPAGNYRTFGRVCVHKLPTLFMANHIYRHFF
jgi:hypothetical protein